MRLRAEPASVSVARTFVAHAAEVLHYDRAVAEALRLATTEAVANAIEHGAPCADSRAGDVFDPFCALDDVRRPVGGHPQGL